MGCPLWKTLFSLTVKERDRYFRSVPTTSGLHQLTKTFTHELSEQQFGLPSYKTGLAEERMAGRCNVPCRRSGLRPDGDHWDWHLVLRRHTERQPDIPFEYHQQFPSFQVGPVGHGGRPVYRRGLSWGPDHGMGIRARCRWSRNSTREQCLDPERVSQEFF